ncbi:non-canonical purine NTP pyrophosphatase [Nanoarchaeota archaeon]
MKIFFVTGNKGKFMEVKEIMDGQEIEVEQIEIDKPEMKSDSIKEIAKDAAEKLANQLGKTIVVEDTGFFLKAFNNFPGAHPKFVYDGIGLEGIFKLLEGKDRSAYFKTVAAYSEPGKEAVCFEGVFEGRVADNISDVDSLPGLPYDKMFIPANGDKPWSEIPEAKKEGNHRKEAFEKLAKFLKK